MTIEEAVERIKEMFRRCNDYEDCKYGHDCTVGCLEAIEMAIGKPTPKKPYFEGDGYWNGNLVYDTWICPNCENRYELDFEEYDYCPNCGQRIDWQTEF